MCVIPFTPLSYKKFFPNITFTPIPYCTKLDVDIQEPFIKQKNEIWTLLHERFINDKSALISILGIGP